MKNNYKIKAILLYNILIIITGIFFSALIPSILNYPPDSINNEFETTIDMGLNYYVQAGFVIVVVTSFSTLYLLTMLRKAEKYRLYVGKTDEESIKKLEEVKARCFKDPYKIYITHVFVPNIVMMITLGITGTSLSLTLSIGILLFSLFLVIALLAYIFSKKILNQILFELNNQKKYKNMFGTRFASNIFLFFFPLIFVAISFLAIVSGSLLDKERGNSIFDNYLNKFELGKQNIETTQDITSYLFSIKKYNEDDVYFIITRDGVVYQDQETDGLDDFFIKYTYNVAKDHRTYGYYASNLQAVYYMVTINGVDYAYGILYNCSANQTTQFLTYSFCILFITTLFLVYFSKNIAMQVMEVSENMMIVGNGKNIDYDKKMTVVSNDELGDLVISFNKILDIEKKHNEQMEKNQEILVEQERLSSLGQLIGGIAHNLKTPIMSISGASKAIDDLIYEFNESIGNPKVTETDFHDIATEMREWNDKIEVYLDYMTEIINTAKGQAVSMNASMVTEFNIKELVTRIQILMKEQLMQFNCELNLDNTVDNNVTIAGEISAIIQVLNNLINNAIEAYNNVPGVINLRIYDDKTRVFIEVEDQAGGIPEHIKGKLFKQMITTKGKDGTGLGLYICYSTIKGKFNGDLSFTSQVGKGTTFKIVLNKNI
ncbi:MAG: HAMP domain-containing histidine kinase [Clostridia bacterium]|nr:HAMP domain-containing histidine kinase [Clostridia bacterium]